MKLDALLWLLRIANRTLCTLVQAYIVATARDRERKGEKDRERTTHEQSLWDRESVCNRHVNEKELI
jgi:hypothetical protein